MLRILLVTSLGNSSIQKLSVSPSSLTARDTTYCDMSGEFQRLLR